MPMDKRYSFKIIRQAIFDILIVFSSFVISFFLRGQLDFGGSVGLFSQYSNFIVWYVTVIIIVKVSMFWLFGMYRRVWKYASLKDLTAIVEAVTLSSIIAIVIFYITSHPISMFGVKINFSLPYFPRSIFVIDYLLTLILVMVSRFSERFFNELKFGNPDTRRKRTLIVGAGDAGEMIVREMIRQRNSEYMPVGFLDDDKLKLKQQIHGVKVLDTILNMENVIKKYSVAEVIIAMPSASSKARKEVAFRAKEAGANCKTLPSLYEVIDGKVYLYQIRDIEIEDILGREPVKIKIPDVASEIKDKVVLISGAGGSIGSEICRQILRFGPEEMILVDHSENNLFLVEEELTNKLAFTAVVPIVADIRDREAMKGVFKNYRPSIVFHAAAYKHVPLMQLNPEAAIRNNYLGTKMLAKFSVDFGVSRFVMLSTDKAVQPENVMGVSKLLSEKYLQALSKVKNTRFMIVRFGNVLGSRGSVVPVFKEQIRSGGPLRVTHPDMKRYFMTIPESAQLVIQACIMGKGGEIYVLDMGEPINILDLATNMIKIYGMEPGKDIEIIYTGPRYGEKMDEELVGKDEELVSTELEQIFEAKNKNNVDKEKILDILFNIEKEVQLWDYNNLFKDLKKIVPDFDEKKMWFR
jgi:FlaA1/EpsC-like NDP-sugar epimerase